MRNNLQNDTRIYCMLFAIVLMLAGSFVSRAALSVGMILFVIVSFVHRQPLLQLRNFFSAPYLWLMSLLFFLPLLSGIWSADLHEWFSIARIKLPLFLLPIAFAAPFSLDKKQWWLVLWVMLLLTIAGTIWSMFQYLQQVQAVHAGYLRAQTIQTPLENDHVRFSWLVSVCVLVCFMALHQKALMKTWQKTLLIFVMLWLIIFLHVLAARTGLLCFYAMLVTGFAWLLWKGKMQKSLLTGFVIALFIMPFAAWLALPTFQNRVKYFLYDLRHVNQSQYLAGSNDGARFISLQAGWALMQQWPAGVGFGDIRHESRQWYDLHYPQMIEKDKILPASEWMMYGAGLGWPGFVIFSVLVAIPFFIRKINRHLFCILLQLAALLSFLFDIGLEVQLGVFLYAFTALWLYKGSTSNFLIKD